MKKATLSLFLIFFSVALFSQQPKKLYTPNGTLYHSGTNNIGVNEDKPAAALHIKESDNKSTALQIDVVNRLIPSSEGNVYTQPDFAFKINSYVSDQPGLAQLASIDAKGVMRLGYFGTGSENLRVNHSLGVYLNHANKISLQYDGSSPELLWKTSTNKNFRFKNATTNAIPISLSPSGKVGINTEDFSGDHDLYVNGSVYLKGDSPETHTMYVEGSAIAEEMFIKLKGNWGDFVFHSNYPLLPLNGLQDFIDANGHLPEMPTAEKVAEDGLETGETIRLLNIKVEELTLYILELKREIDSIKAETKD